MNGPRNHVILVDKKDQATGAAEKLQAHRKGLLHRAFSIFLFNAEGKLLLQQRHLDKYHSGGLWSNTCCSHPRPGEGTSEAAHRRLEEEMGLRCVLHPAFGFVYRAAVGSDLYEHEYDHVFVGGCDEVPAPDAREVADWQWVDTGWLEENIKLQPARYTHWFRLSLHRVVAYHAKHAQEGPSRPFR